MVARRISVVQGALVSFSWPYGTQSGDPHLALHNLALPYLGLTVTSPLHPLSRSSLGAKSIDLVWRVFRGIYAIGYGIDEPVARDGILPDENGRSAYESTWKAIVRCTCGWHAILCCTCSWRKDGDDLWIPPSWLGE